MKKTIKYLLLSCLLVILAGCATASDHQAACEARFGYFPDMVNCLTQTLNLDYRYRFGRKSDLGQLYLAYANKLADEVRSGQMTNEQAYQALDALYIKLNNWTDPRINPG